MARAYAALDKAPRRTILFAAVAAEEQGLLGSEWYAKHPTVPPGKIAANINIDSINKDGKTLDLGFIGFGKSSLDAVVESLAKAQGRTVKADPFPDRGAFYRSDQLTADQVLAGGLLEDVARGAGHDRGEQRLVVVVGREDQGADVRVDGADLAADVDPGAVGKARVEDRDLGAEGGDARDGLGGERRLADHLDVVPRLQEGLSP